MERSMIIKALELHSVRKPCVEECPYGNRPYCGVDMAKDTLALIKELTEECENYKSIAEYQQSCNMDRGFKIKRLTEENERLKQLNESYAELEQGCFVTAVKKFQALTVREMQDRLNLRIKDKLAYHGWYLTDTLIPTIVDEILNKNTEEENGTK